MANLNLDYACVGLNPSQYIVIAYVTDIEPWEYREYIFSVDNPDVVFNAEQNTSKFIFYLKYNQTVNVTCTVNLYDYNYNMQKHIYSTISKTITIESIDDGTLFRTRPRIKLNRAETSYIPSYASFSVDIPDCGIPPFEYSWNVFSEHPYMFFAEDDRLFLIAMGNGTYRIACSVTDAGGITVSESLEEYVLLHRVYKIAEANQSIFDISDCCEASSIYFDIYHNGLHMIESLDYTIDVINKRLIFNFPCRKNDVITIYNFYRKYDDITTVNVNTKTLIATQNQTVYDIADIYVEGMSNIIVFRNGLQQVEGLDYIFVFDTKSIVFNYGCNENDIITINNYVNINPNYAWLDMKRITSVADLGQYIFDISDDYNNNVFDIMVFRNGLLEIYDAAYTVENEQIRFVYPCDENDVITILILYQNSVASEYVLEVDGVPIEEDSSAIYKRKSNVFKGKLSVPYDVPDADKDALLAEINLLNSYDMRHILLFKRDKASDSNFFNAIKNLDAIYSNAQYRLCAVAFDSDNYLYFYVKCTSDYAAKTAANRLIETVSWVIYKHGYRAKDDKIAFTYEYEPALYSEQVVSDMTAYLEHVMQTKYNRMDLLEVHDALKGEVTIFLESLRNTDPIIMPGLQKI